MNLALGCFWFFYFAGYGIFFPYFTLYLGEQQGFSGTQVGLILGTMPLVGLLAQPLWGRVADRTGSRRGVLALTVAGAASAHLILGMLQGFSAVLAATAVLALFSTTVVPLATAVSLAVQNRSDAGGFGRVRLWGTLGFLIMVVAFPRLIPLLPKVSAAPWQGLSWMFPLIAVLSIGAIPAALALPHSESLTVRSAPGDTRFLLRHPPVRYLLATVFAAQLFMQGPINLFPLLVVDLGGGADELSRLWVYMLALEIPLIGFAGTALRRLGARGLLTLGLAAEGLRWLLTALSPHVAVVHAAQLLHGVGVAGVIVGGPLYLELCTPSRLRATAQALVATFGVGLASIISLAAAGWLFDHFGPRFPYLLSGLGASLLAVIVRLRLPPPSRPLDEGSAILEG